MTYEIDIAPAAMRHMRRLSAGQRAAVLDGIGIQLTHQPTMPTRNRKLMRPNPLAPWELRLGDLRVYYDVEEAPKPIVRVRAVGVKDRNVVRCGGEVYEL